jgi:hypothetical protein
MIYQKYHRQIILSAGLQYLIELVKTAAAVNHVVNHFKVSEFHSRANVGVITKSNKNYCFLAVMVSSGCAVPPPIAFVGKL